MPWSSWRPPDVPPTLSRFPTSTCKPAFFLRGGEAHLLDTSSLVDRTLAGNAAAVALSGDGRVVYAFTGRGGLLKINPDDGTTIDLIGRTPYISGGPGLFTPGLTASVGG